MSSLNCDINDEYEEVRESSMLSVHNDESGGIATKIVEPQVADGDCGGRSECNWLVKSVIASAAAAAPAAAPVPVAAAAEQCVQQRRHGPH